MFDDLTTMMTVSGHSQDLGYLQIDQLLLPILEAYQQQIEQQHRELIGRRKRHSSLLTRRNGY